MEAHWFELCECRALYEAGAPYLVLQPPVVLRSRAGVLSFCSYFLIEPPRFKLLRSLEIRALGRFEAGPKVDLFLTMLICSKHLEQLKVLDPEILLSDKRIAAAVAALMSLKSVTFSEMNWHVTNQILKTCQSPLTQVNISFWGKDTIAPGDPVPLLDHFTHSLRHLYVTYAEFTPQSTQYPFIDLSSVDDCRFALEEPLVQSFPNMRGLSMWTGQEDEELEDEESEEHRQIT